GRSASTYYWQFGLNYSRPFGLNKLLARSASSGSQPARHERILGRSASIHLIEDRTVSLVGSTAQIKFSCIFLTVRNLCVMFSSMQMTELGTP
ncbi:hypothetical protein VIGAN_UM011900, partial [Vigna angularis var. angularis]